MSEGRPDDGGAAEQGGVFGNLPGSRPGARSPRRRSGGRQPAARAAPKPRPRQRASEPEREPRQAPPRAEPEPAEAGHTEGGGIEDIAWAGVAVAAEAATIGVRLASRAIEALRGSAERD